MSSEFPETRERNRGAMRLCATQWKKLGSVAARVSGCLLGFSSHRRWTFTPTSKQNPLFSLCSRWPFLPPATLHPYTHPCWLRAGGSIGQHLLREAGGPTPRTAPPFPNARTAHLWKLNWQTDISMRSASLLLSVYVFLSLWPARAQRRTHRLHRADHIVYLCILYPHAGASTHKQTLMSRGREHIQARTHSSASKKKCAQARACTAICACPRRKRSRSLDTYRSHEITFSGYSCRRAQHPGPRVSARCCSSRSRVFWKKRVTRDFSDWSVGGVSEWSRVLSAD